MKNICKKTIVTSIILLLLGVSISSAFVIDTKQSMVNSKREENCGCKKVSDADLLLIERSLERLLFTINMIKFKLNDYPVFQKITNEFLDILTSNGIIWEIICELIISFVGYIVEFRDTYFGNAGLMNWWLTVLSFSTYQFWKQYCSNR